ncbi:MAG TPA: prepilin-type N-terminal cleavage/methylation domain-containing protein [Bacillota bacterium]|nr:prepilin-type N-terminal cleavage/methylation domain-containing protein [Bacillota bacterium]
MRKNKGFSLIEVMTSFSIVLMLILTLLPIVSLLNKERDVLNKRSLISIRLHDTLQDYIRLEHVTPDTRQTTVDGTDVHYTFTDEGEYVKGCAEWNNIKNETEEVCLYGYPEK